MVISFISFSSQTSFAVGITLQAAKQMLKRQQSWLASELLHSTLRTNLAIKIVYLHVPAFSNSEAWREVCKDRRERYNPKESENFR